MGSSTIRYGAAMMTSIVGPRFLRGMFEKDAGWIATFVYVCRWRGAPQVYPPSALVRHVSRDQEKEVCHASSF